MKGILIKYVDHMGDDFRVYEAAKATMGGSCESPFSRGVTDPTRLINFLAKNKHITPFRHPQVSFECEAPIAIARQLGKHQVGASWNERSMRYRDSVIDVFIPEMFRSRPDTLHDGSTEKDVGEELVHSSYKVRDIYQYSIDKSLTAYNALIDAGLAPEQARFVLPQGMITRWIWTGSLYFWFEVWRQRSSEHAQYEVREFAKLLDEEMNGLFPISWDALKQNSEVSN